MPQQPRTRCTLPALALMLAALAALLTGAADRLAAAGAAPFTTVLLPIRGGDPIRAYLLKPVVASNAPVPVVIALHGCGGVLNRRGALSRRHADWAARWTAAGYAVLFPDSFVSRGHREICTIPYSRRTIRPAMRAGDVAAAVDWLTRQSFADPDRLALIGWSNGGSSILATLQSGATATVASRFKSVLAFYPGCRVAAREAAGGQVRLTRPVTILIGAADDWTPPRHCRDLARLDRAVTLVEYPNAVHGFDSPGSPRRTRTDTGYAGAGGVQVGTDPKARAAAIELATSTLAAAFRPR